MPSEKSGKVLAIDYHEKQVTIDYGTGLLVVEKNLFLEYPLTLGQLMDETILQWYENEAKFQKGLKKALGWLQIRDYTTHDLKVKLILEFDDSVCERILAYLAKLNYLSDERFLTDAIEKAKKESKGRIRVIEELKQKGIEGPLIELVDEKFSYLEEINLAKDLVQTWMKKQPMSISFIRSCQQKLFFRGFSEEIIETVLQPYMERFERVEATSFRKKGRKIDD